MYFTSLLWQQQGHHQNKLNWKHMKRTYMYCMFQHGIWWDCQSRISWIATIANMIRKQKIDLPKIFVPVGPVCLSFLEKQLHPGSFLQICSPHPCQWEKRIDAINARIIVNNICHVPLIYSYSAIPTYTNQVSIKSVSQLKMEI